TADLVGAEFDEEYGAFRIQRHAVGARISRRWREQLDLAALRVKTADPVEVLHREPQHSVVVEDERMWIALLRGRVFSHASGLRIEFSDQGARVARIPNVAVTILLQAVRSGVRCLELEFREFAGRRIEPSEYVGQLASVPERPVPCRQRV